MTVTHCGQGHMTKMAAMPINGNNWLLKIFSWNQWVNDPGPCKITRSKAVECQ